jgi:DNA-binding GntR family transcriptional regulator
LVVIDVQQCGSPNTQAGPADSLRARGGGLGGQNSRDEENESMNRIESRSLAEQVFGILERAILSNELTPGTELSEIELAERYGVSRGPVREALRRLGSDGLVSLTPRHPAVVRIMSKKEVLDAYQVREALEQLGVRIAIPLLTAEDLLQLDRRVGEMQDAADDDDVDRFFQANGEFHQIFITASGNLRLQETHSSVSRSMAQYRRRSLALRGDLCSSLEEHERIMKAVRARDAGLAASLVADHIHVTQDRLEELSDEAWGDMSSAAGGQAAVDQDLDRCETESHRG